LGHAGGDCRQTLVAATASRQEIRVECGRGGGTIRVDAADGEHATVSSNFSARDDARKMKLESTATLRWLGAVCDLKAAAKPEAPKVEAPANDPGYYYKLGKEQTARSDFWGALKSLNRAIELDPQRAIFYNARGYAYLRLGSFANAVVDFSDAIRLRPDYGNAYQNRAIARRHMGEQQAAEEDEKKAASEHPAQRR
jgi:Flp pilus assembly protein TadD